MKTILILVSVAVMLAGLVTAPVAAQVIRIDTSMAITSQKIANSTNDTLRLKLRYMGTGYRELQYSYPDSVHVAWYAADSVKLDVKTHTAYEKPNGALGTFTTLTTVDSVLVAESATETDFKALDASTLQSKDWLEVVAVARSAGNKLASPYNTLYVRVERYFKLTTPRKL